MDFPHYHLIPKDFEANIKWRQDVLREGANDPDFAAAVWRMCAEDILFYINGFCWVYEPRDTAMPKKPFITYKDYQDEAIELGVSAIRGGYDIAWPKSRTMGASWKGLTIYEWFWHFSETPLAFGLVSRKAEYVDAVGDMKTLFGKIDFLHKHQPTWLLPTGRHLGWKDPNRRLFHMENEDTGTTIDGEATTGDMFAGARLTSLFIDEHGRFEVNDGYNVLYATRDVTKCRFFNATPRGVATGFYDVVHKTGTKIFYMHWRSHPIYNVGRYTSIRQPNGTHKLKLLTDFKGTVTTLRKEWDAPRNFNYPDDYPFILDGKERSPWYDHECARCASPQEIAQELDINFLGSDYQFFDQEFVQILIAEYCCDPILVGRLEYDPITLDPTGFRIDKDGPLQLWFNLQGSTNILTDKSFMQGKAFGLGSDVSHGTGASNSATSIVDLTTGKKVALWKDSNTEPDDFAKQTIALAKWFNNGFMIWDGGGPTGKSFTKRVMEEKYSRIYYRRNELKTRARITDQPGYYLNDEDRTVLLQDYRTKLIDRVFINPSEAGMVECLHFVVKPGGKVVHSAAANSQDPTGAREAHGDETIADALASRVLSLQPKELEKSVPEAPWMSPAWRLQQEELALAAAEREDW